MLLYKKQKDLRAYLDQRITLGEKIGFVPTMGALHAGHISLVESSTAVNSTTVCSIFVNPTQFNDPKDFAKYPITLEQDIQLLTAGGCNVLFLPAVDEVYPDGAIVDSPVDLGYLDSILEGKYRPGHFKGVCTVVKRLLDMVQPDNLYLGQKDYQQCMVIGKLVSECFPKTKVTVCPIVREADGLAMSSRNMRLTKEERSIAPVIYSTLRWIEDKLREHSLVKLQSEAMKKLENANLRVDYVEIADATTLKPVDAHDDDRKLVALVAAFLNEVRLIDNMILI